MENTKSDEEFQIFLEDLESGRYASPLEIPPRIWELTAWDRLSKKEVQEIFLPLIRWQLQRAVRTMPEIYRGYQEKHIAASAIQTMDDFWRIPGLVKDASKTGFGFRDKVAKNPFSMKPEDVQSACYVFKSGGTRGVATPTFITGRDRAIEAAGLKRCFAYMGITPASRVLSTYNPTHKGGELIKEALGLLGATFIPRRITDDPQETVRTIQMYGVDVVATVQGSLQEGDHTRKGGGVDFLSLVEHGQEVLEQQVRTLFITGYTLIPEVVNWTELYGKNLATTLGSSECIPQATSTVGMAERLCKYNNLHVLYGPHYIEVVKEESGTLVPAKAGEPGLLCYTTVAREGTIYIRYLPGDSAQVVGDAGTCPCGIRSEIITDIGRLDIPEDVVMAGCCIG